MDGILSILATIQLFAPAASAAPAARPAAAGDRAKTARAQAEVLVEGMRCAKCAANLTAAVEALDGVARAQVDLPGARVLVWFDPQKVTVVAIVEAIRSVGFEPGAPKVSGGR